MGDITGANATYMLSITSLFPAPIPLEGFAVDDVFDTEDLEISENIMGVDGKMSSGIVFNPVKQTVMLQADSASNDLFDAWAQTQRQLRQVLYANAIVLLTSVGKTFVCTKGSLTTYKPVPTVKKLLQPRKYAITWESVLPTPG